MKYVGEAVGGSREQTALRITVWGARVLRYGLALVIAWIGLMKFTEYEANGIQPLVSNSPLLGWAYHFLSARQLSGALGVAEVGVAILIALRPWSAKASAAGSAMAALMFLTTLSFLFSTPGWEPSLGGFPSLSAGVGQFLLKDVVLLGAALWSLGESLKHASRTQATEGGHRMKRVAVPVSIVLLVAACAPLAFVSGRAEGEGAAVFVKTIPPGYRDWRFISVAHEEGDLNDLRVILGNDVAIKTYRQGKLPFPEGTIIARIAWKHVASQENNRAFGREQSFVPGEAPPWYLQFMVKDSKKYAATGGWGYAQFDKEGKPATDAQLNTCFTCHKAVTARDYVFTRYAP